MTRPKIIWRFCKLLADDGSSVDVPQFSMVSVSVRTSDGSAYAWAEDGRTPMAELIGARIAWIEDGGVRIDGLEPIGTERIRYRAQAWHLVPHCADYAP